MNAARLAPMGQQLAADLLGLSPKLQQVAQYCLQHARHLHLCRIQDVAGQCNTQPVTVVRLAKRYGYRGFLDFKMAFLAETHADLASDSGQVSPPHTLPGPRKVDTLGAVLTHHARATMDQHRSNLLQLEDDWGGQAFCKAITLLKRANRVWMHGSPAALRMAHCHAEFLRAAGLSVQWIRPHKDNTAIYPAHRGPAIGLTPNDVLLSLSLACDGEGELDAVYMAQRMGVPVVALTDQPHGLLAQTADVHLCVAALSTALGGMSAGMLLAHALA